MKHSLHGKKILRRMRYISDQKGILNRFIAEGDNWESHLEQTKEFIIQCMDEMRYESVAVLGSGWLLDLPLDYIAGKCDKLYLVDIVHPPQVLKRAEKFMNIELITADITGGAIEGVYRYATTYERTGRGSILDISFQATIQGIQPDFIISLNTLNQLDILLIDYLKKFVEIPVAEEMEFRKRIQLQHLSLLEPGRSCLITDAEEQVINRKGQKVSSKNLIHCDLPEGSNEKEWIWTFDSRGEYNKRHLTEMLVRAVKV